MDVESVRKVKPRAPPPDECRDAPHEDVQTCETMEGKSVAQGMPRASRGGQRAVLHEESSTCGTMGAGVRRGALHDGGPDLLREGCPVLDAFEENVA